MMIMPNIKKMMMMPTESRRREKRTVPFFMYT